MTEKELPTLAQSDLRKGDFKMDNKIYDTPYHRGYSGIGVRATRIRSAATAKDQNTPFSKLGLTIVTLVREADQYELLKSCARLHEARKSFRSLTATLHLTILGILGRNRPNGLTEDQFDKIEEGVKEVMDEELASEPPFSIVLQGVASRRGLDGNVVVAVESTCRRHIEGISERLQKKLEPRLLAIHPGLEVKRVEGIKITLGYFNEPKDFRIDYDLALAFEELRHMQAELVCDQVALVRFRFKSLEDAINSVGDAKIVKKIDLGLPGASPIRPATAAPKAKPKVLATPYWTRWCGFSYLFDNPGEGLLRCVDTGLAQVACEPWTDPELELYRALGDALAEVGLGSANNPFSLYPLPSTSYHCTVFDGINEESLIPLAETERKRFIRFLLRLPESARYTPPDLIPPDAFDGIIFSDQPIPFKFDKLDLWGDAVLVARLTPANDASMQLLEQVSERRAQLDERFASMGRPPSLEYVPHISLAYANNTKAACEATTHLPEWDQAFRQRTAGQQLAFRSISPYAFTSMTTFFKLEFT